VKHNPLVTALFLTLGFTLSFLSDLDCFFIEVDIGSVPHNSFFSTPSLGFGLWSFEDPEVRGRCITPLFVESIGGLTTSDQLYANAWSNGDIYWTIARIISACGLCVGFSAMTFVWVCICIDSKGLQQLQITILIATVALGCEGTKFGLFFETTPCTSKNFWEYYDPDGLEIYHQAAACSLSRGTYMSTASLVFYSLCITYLLLVRFRPSYQHLSMEDGFDYDDVTLPSFLGSIGKSVNSKFSKASHTSSSINSRVSSTGTPSTNSVSDQSETSAMTRRASNGNQRRLSLNGLPAIRE